jgi:hypothetical protein
MKPEEQIDQKELVKMIRVLNATFNTKIKSKGSITDLAEAFATGVEALNNRNEALPESVIDFYNDLFNDESMGYKDVDIAKTLPAEPPEEESLPFEETKPELKPDDEGVEELPELDPEQELPGEEDNEEPMPKEEELEELDPEPEPTPPKRSRGRPPIKKPEAKKQAPVPTQKKISKVRGSNPKPKKEIKMLEQLQSIDKKGDLKAFVKQHNVNVKLKNNESAVVWKAKIKKIIESALAPAPAETSETDLTPAPEIKKKVLLRPKVESKPPKPVKTKPEVKKPVKLALVKPTTETAKKEGPKRSRGEKDAFGITKGSLTHSFVQAILKKPQTMKMLIDAGIGKHPKALKKLMTMGYMERDKTGIITMTVKGRKVYGDDK